MTTKVRRKDLASKLTNHLGINYITLISVMKSVILANAAYSIFVIIDKGHLNTTIFIFWLASFLSMVLIYQAFTVGIIIISWIPTVKDVILPFAVGITEFLMFSTLTSSHTILHWHLIFSLFSAAGFFNIWNVIRETKLSNYDEELHTLVKEYIRFQKADCFMASSSTVVWFIIWIVVQNFPSLQQYQWISGIAAVVIMLIAIFFSDRDRKFIARYILEKN